MALLLSTSLVSLGAAPKLDLLFATLPTAGGEPIDHGDSIDHKKPQVVPSNRPENPKAARKPTRRPPDSKALTGAPCDPTGMCPNSHVGDDFCDPHCLDIDWPNLALSPGPCTNDMGNLKLVSDCDGQDGRSSKCPTTCERGWRGDQWCDTECNVEPCNYDTAYGLDPVQGDCLGLCAPGCQLSFPGDGICDPACDNEDCNYDSANGEADCGKDYDGNVLEGEDCLLSLGCQHGWRGDGDCDAVCDNAVCNYDTAKDANGSPGNPVTDSDCTHTVVNNTIVESAVVKRCDSEGANECEIDVNGIGWEKDKYCDPVCNVEECNYDDDQCVNCNQNDGEICYPREIGDGNCDEACNVETCEFDGGDCSNDEGYDYY